MTALLDEKSNQHESDVTAAASVLEKLGKFICPIAPGVILEFMRQGNSIVTLFVCENQTGMKNLGNLYVSGALKSMLEECFTRLLVTDDPQATVHATVHVKKLVWELFDYCRCFLYFNPLPKRE